MRGIVNTVGVCFNDLLWGVFLSIFVLECGGLGVFI